MKTKIPHLLISLIFLAGSMAGVHAESADLMNWKWAGNVQKSTEQVKEGAFSLRWNAGKEQGGSFSTKVTDSDWTRYAMLHAWVYSEKATGAKVGLSIATIGTQPGNHYIYGFTVDWEGWKEFNIPLKEIPRNRKPGSWAEVEKLEFVAHFFAPPIPGTVLFVNDLKLVE